MQQLGENGNKLRKETRYCCKTVPLVRVLHHVLKQLTRNRSSENANNAARVTLTFTFTFTFGEDSMLSSAEAVFSLGPMRSPEITERLYKSPRGFCKPQKSMWLNLLKFCDIH